MTNKEIPIWQKLNLTLEEAAQYSGVGIERLRSIISQPSCKFVIKIGNQKRLIKRKAFEEYMATVDAL